MYQRRDYKKDESISVGFKANTKLAEAINLAAELAKAPSKANYLMQVVAERVAKDLGVTVESLTPPDPSTSSAILQDAAINIARLQQTIADAQMSLDNLRAQSAPRRQANSVSGFHRKVS